MLVPMRGTAQPYSTWTSLREAKLNTFAKALPVFNDE